ncbi:DUF5658 family protein [Desulfuribacillus alkaliarsenatis]|uniref:DUF5658 domain-containing protein n=1 Tax=Desulfuribacillus alkaliarsenatis TaxID=766136 RepID=A0A1E5G361_9FIRM|nr:DUF5658 family protein [Desulfuribacillus alkaliarsenatis]OEF97512.1 hypothetical protein BHF68_04715 [Desulfuribacillus alkaliarsenatis]
MGYDNKLLNQLSLIYVLSCLDYVITRISLPLGAMELNPLLAPIIESYIGGALKLLMPLFVLYYLWIRRNSNRYRVYLTAIILSAFYVLVVSWNIFVYLVFLV